MTKQRKMLKIAKELQEIICRKNKKVEVLTIEKGKVEIKSLIQLLKNLENYEENAKIIAYGQDNFKYLYDFGKIEEKRTIKFCGVIR